MAPNTTSIKNTPHLFCSIVDNLDALKKCNTPTNILQSLTFGDTPLHLPVCWECLNNSYNANSQSIQYEYKCIQKQNDDKKCNTPTNIAERLISNNGRVMKLPICLKCLTKQNQATS